MKYLILFSFLIFINLIVNCDSMSTIPETKNEALIDTSSGFHSIPHRFNIEEPYPNPFSDKVTARIDIPIEAYITIVIQNPLGDVFKIIAAQNVEAGFYRVEWNGKNSKNKFVKDGIYFITLESKSPSFIQSRIIKYKK